MPLFHRRESPPARIVALLEPDDRVLSWADVDDGEVVLASRHGLWWPDSTGPRLIRWQFVDKVVWRDDALTVIEAELRDDLILVDLPAQTVRVTRPRDLPPTVRKRVEANVVHSQVYALPGGAGRFVARRIPGRDGLVWWVRLEPGTLDTEQVRDEARRVIEQLQRQYDSVRAE
ncbi:MAG TPA: hypothetical protein VGH01_05110 [Jatrophihabitantaceae bacterium]|jgi:hypothetical protein